MPDDWTKEVIVPLYEGKGRRNDFKNWRRICLMSIVTKVFGRTVTGRVRRMMNPLYVKNREGLGRQEGVWTRFSLSDR